MDGVEQAYESVSYHEVLNPDSQVVILDTGAQTADLIYWSLVESGIRPELMLASRGVELNYNYIKTKQAVIFSGSRESVNAEGAPQIPTDPDMPPTLGICYGGQALAKAYGGKVKRVDIDGHDRGEFGQAVIDVSPEAVIYGGVKKAKVLMSHHDSITHIPKGFHVTGRSGKIIASFESVDGKIVGTQFHPEVKETDDGHQMLRRFLVKTAGIIPDPDFTLEVALNEMMDREEASIAERLARGDFIAGFLSGGVDSMVAAKAVVDVAERLGRLDQVKFFYVDNGHMRLEDEEIIDDMLSEGMPVEKIDAVHEFFHSRVEVTKKDGTILLAPPLIEEADTEVKRLIIGTIFKNISRRIREEIIANTGGKVHFVQGTNASDLTESREVKPHHNVTVMDEDRRAGHLLEPLRHLLKYHVRHLAETRYGLPKKFAARAPFPGVGFSPRIIVNLTGNLEKPEANLQQRLDELVGDKVGKTIVPHLIKMKTVGVKGDSRSVADAVFLSGDENWKNLEMLAGFIPDHFNSINRIFYVPDIEINRDNIVGTEVRDDEKFTNELREMEEIHRQAMLKEELDEYISQHFVGTLPIDLLGNSGLPLLAARLFITGDQLEEIAKRRTGSSKETFRTGVAAIPGIHVDAPAFKRFMQTLQSSLRYHSALAYDLTTKSPGATEWE